MKNVFRVLTLAFGFMVLSATQAHATNPMIDGVASVGEWDALPTTGSYSTYLTASSTNDPGIPDAYDFMTAVVIQDLDAFGGDPALPDGIYVYLAVYGGNPSLEAHGQNPGDTANIALSIDFVGTGPGVDLLLFHDVGPFAIDGTGQTVSITNFGTATTVDLLAAGGAFTVIDGNRFGTGCGAAFDPGCTLGGGPITAIEYFIPTGTAGTPGIPLPAGTYHGSYDNGGAPNDDFIIGSTVIPEPSTMLMLGAGLLGLAGFGARLRK